MPVEFVVQRDDLRQATAQLKANRGKYVESDFVDIVVSKNVAIFRAVGSESEVLVDCAAPGSVRVPLRMVDKISQSVTTLKTNDLSLHCEPGIIRIGTLSFKHSDIELDKVPLPRLDLPIDLSLLDTLALTKILSPLQVAEEGMRARVEDAHYTRRSVIADALASLKALEIEERHLSHFVDCHVHEAAKRLQKTLRAA